MANKLKLAHERRKVALRGAILSGRARIAAEQERVRRLRDELKAMTPRQSSSTAMPRIPTVRVAGQGR